MDGNEKGGAPLLFSHGRGDMLAVSSRLRQNTKAFVNLGIDKEISLTSSGSCSFTPIFLEVRIRLLVNPSHTTSHGMHSIFCWQQALHDIDTAWYMPH
jgi:hypothetical protein